MRGRILSLFGALRRDRGGNALVEFAVAFPVLVLLYVGSFVMSDAIACNRKVTITARALTDLATRYSNLTQAEAATILSASSQVMSPYTPANAVIVLSFTHPWAVPRYVVILFPMYLLMARLGRRPLVFALMAAWSLLFLSFFSSLFVRGFWAF